VRVSRACVNTLPDPRTFAYRIDVNDRIEWVSDTWKAFARENGAAHLADNAVGTRLWDHITGVETREIYRALFARARASMRPACVPFRCDAPARVRAMELTLIALPDHSIEIRCVEQWGREREPIGLLDATLPRSDELLAMCSWCKRVRLDEWIEPEVAVARLGLFVDTAVLPRLTHGICPQCQAELTAGI